MTILVKFRKFDGLTNVTLDGVGRSDVVGGKGAGTGIVYVRVKGIA